ncbi:MAG: PmoA family protein [Deltaproteobacteria bacterium]|nr:PmoA family protein [Deltaproteobacteria bacterium]
MEKSIHPDEPIHLLNRFCKHRCSSCRLQTETGPPAHHYRDHLLITIGGEPFATYYIKYEDPAKELKITRPFFAHVKTPSGIQATRNHPPIKGQDKTDHADYHPGIFLAFGDISGHDSWRMKARVEHKMYVGKPKGGPGKGTFTVRNFYLKEGSRERVCAELCMYTILVREHGTLLLCESTFSSDTGDFTFGDQEEMGLGIRVNTKISVELGDGHMTNAEDLKDGEGCWGKQSDWIDYSGIVDDQYIGMAIMPDPKNFRRSWYHARDYGFIAANAFGRDAMEAGEKSAVTVKRGETFHLGYGVLIYSVPVGLKVDIDYAYQDYLKQLKK